MNGLRSCYNNRVRARTQVEGKNAEENTVVEERETKR